MSLKVAQLEAWLAEAEGNVTKGTLTPRNIHLLQVCDKTMYFPAVFRR